MAKAIKKTKAIEVVEKKNVSKKKDDFGLILKKISDDVTSKIDDLKKRFDKVDTDTKNKIITGLSVVAAGLVVLVGVKKIKNKKKSK